MEILVNKIQCNKCKQILESNDDTVKYCKCNTVGVTGGTTHLMRYGRSSEYTELSVFEESGEIIKTEDVK